MKSIPDQNSLRLFLERIRLFHEKSNAILLVKFLHLNQQIHCMKSLIDLYKTCRESDTSFIIVIFRLIICKVFYHKILLLHQRVRLRGIKNINAPERIAIGTEYVGFMHRTDKTYLNIKGTLSIKGKYNIGRGCRFDIGKDAMVTIGRGGYMNCNTTLIIMHSLTIGDDCAISWNCQFLDEDFHEIDYPGKKMDDASIVIGNRVWVGCGVKIYKGTVIPDGCVIASDAVVRGVFTVENAIIGGNPAKVIKEGITRSWFENPRETFVRNPYPRIG